MFIAACRGQVEVVKLLCRKGADLDVQEVQKYMVT